MLRTDMAPVWLRSDGHRRDDCSLRADFFTLSWRPQIDVECPPPARIGLAQLQSRAVRALEPRERGATWRCRGDRAFLGRFGLQAGHGKRYRAGDLPRQRAEYRIGISPI